MTVKNQNHARVGRKIHSDRSVYDLAVERIEHAFAIHDTVSVSFSGGKDSTAVLNLALDTAERLGRLPLDVVHFDEEAIPYETEHYVRRVAADPRVSLRWFCLPVKHRNGCSYYEPHWYPWGDESADKWVRPLPPEGIIYTQHAHFCRAFRRVEARPSMPESVGLLYNPRDHGTTCMLMGIRADESFSRYRAVAKLNTPDNWITPHSSGYGWVGLVKGYPIYDWTTKDVWTAPAKYGWDVNLAYDLMEMAGIPWSTQRCAPPYGEEPMQGLWMFKTCFPDIWDRMSTRVAGAATAALYSRTELYGFGIQPEPLPDQTWEEFCVVLIERWPEPTRTEVRRTVIAAIDYHRGKTHEPMAPTVPHPLTGHSWRLIANIALRGDFKDRRRKQAQMTTVVGVERDAAYVKYRAEIEGQYDQASPSEGRF